MKIPKDYIKRKGNTIPFGYEESNIEGYFKPIPEQLSSLDTYIQGIKNQEYSLRQAASFLTEETGRKISHVALKNYIVPQTKPSFTRFNVFLRDKFSCQYCGSGEELTFDHLLPRSKGGETNWDNVVTACSECNVKKGGKLLKTSGMKLSQYPYQPSTEDLHRNGKNFPPNYLHKSWMDYLYWDVELEA